MTDRPAGSTSPSERRWALVTGLVVIATYAGLAAWSASLTPLARGPLLDGLGPVNYRWVSPPPELEATNQRPRSRRVEFPLGKDGIGTQALLTPDGQVTVVIEEGSIRPAPGQRRVEVFVEAVDPAELAPPGGDLAAFGNAYAISASYVPSGDAVDELAAPWQVILLYPATSSLHATTHQLLYSPDGEAWESLETTDTPAGQQAEARMPGLGYTVVAGVPTPLSPSPTGTASGGTPTAAIVLLVAAGVMLLIGVGLLIRSRAK